MELLPVAEGTSARRRHVALLPYPGRGHINPMLCLARRLAARGLLITVVLTEEWLSLLSRPPLPPAVRLRAIPDVVPSERARGADFASFIQAVLTRMGGPVAALLEELDPPPDAIVADAMLPWAAAVARRMSVPVAVFFPQAATVFSALQEAKTLAALRPQTDQIGDGDNYFLRYIPRPASNHLADFITHSNGEGMLQAFIEGISWFTSAQYVLFNSFSKLENRALDKLRSKLSVPFYSIGPLVPDTLADEDATDNHSCYKWLDSQPKTSVLYVSLSSFLPFSNEEIKEIAVGLRLSRYPFLWAVRDSMHIQELIGEKGMVVPWCDQARVLCHPSVGGFLTHCGWNSTLEGVHAGVPMLTFPLMWDQYPNSKLIVDDWQVGLRLKDDDKRDMVGREEVARGVQRLMDLKAEESKELRRKVMELKEKSHATLREKGSSAVNFNVFVDEIMCKDGN
ncbi:hypothetical protein Cni_G24566 [Canna indica]|uniref:Glycosyltransferase n=1 Tax=Canna indica TaxID=4628 RepID=A0AAQ3KWE5_9LILI|nr:hypothetical protein Cni_G24566 [Canna indica]